MRMDEEIIGEKANTANKPGNNLNIDNLINHLVANEKIGNRAELKLGRFADHQQLDSAHNIVHMMFTQVKKDCLVFVRNDDKGKKQTSENTAATGKIVVYRKKVNI